MGAPVGIRNPQAHGTLPAMRMETALDYLTLSSLLMRRLDLVLHSLTETDSDAAKALVARIEEAAPGSVPGRIEGWWGHLSRYDQRLIRVYALRDWDHIDGGYQTDIPPDTTDRDGVFRFEEVLPGNYLVFAYSEPPRGSRGRRPKDSGGATFGLEEEPNEPERFWWIRVNPARL